MATQKHEGDGSGNLLVISQHCYRNITTEVCCVCVRPLITLWSRNRLEFFTNPYFICLSIFVRLFKLRNFLIVFVPVEKISKNKQGRM